MKCYLDDVECYSLNEITIYWNSPLVFVMAGKRIRRICQFSLKNRFAVFITYLFKLLFDRRNYHPVSDQKVVEPLFTSSPEKIVFCGISLDERVPISVLTS